MESKSHLVANFHVSRALLVTVLCLAALSTTTTVKAQLVWDYYKGKCPNKYVVVEDVVSSAVLSAFSKNRATMAGVMRIHFHDCFVNVGYSISQF